ncbi:hypothetical protein VNO77_32234 [Canavalia gladiata]|uniref:Uncharacterized protein n=1 Tax=Canavalia gladiata TaxID=3824 RepID=A0AAN9KPM9_CANGL
MKRWIISGGIWNFVTCFVLLDDCDTLQLYYIIVPFPFGRKCAILGRGEEGKQLSMFSTADFALEFVFLLYLEACSRYVRKESWSAHIDQSRET